MSEKPRPGLERAGRTVRSSAAATVVAALAVGSAVALAAAGGAGPLAALQPHPQATHLVEAKALPPVTASLLFPPPKRRTVHREVDIYDAAAPQVVQVPAAGPASAPSSQPSPTQAPAPPAPAPAPSPTPTDDGGGGIDP